jgi:hypothetical protein
MISCEFSFFLNTQQEAWRKNPFHVEKEKKFRILGKKRLLSGTDTIHQQVKKNH